MKTTIRNQAELANALGVSQRTVSVALSGKGDVSESTRKRVLQAAAKANYRPNGVARAMRSSQTHQVGVLIRNGKDRPFHNPAVFDFLLGLNQYLEEHQFLMSMIRFDDMYGPEEQVSRFFHEHLFDGVIVVDAMPESVNKQIEELAPICVWVETNNWQDHNCIRRDEFAAASLIGERLAALGYRRIYLMGCSPSANPVHFSVTERIAGLRHATQAAGIELVELALPILKNYLPVAIDPQVIQSICKPEYALVADMDAVHWILQASALGLFAGTDYGMVSVALPYAVRLAAPEITHVSFDRFHMGQVAGRMLLQRINNQAKPCPSIRLASQWVAGNTALGPGSKIDGRS